MNYKKYMVPLIIGITAIIVIILIIFLINKFTNSNDIKDSDKGSTNISEVDLDEYRFKFPKDINYKINNNIIMISPKDNRWKVELELFDGNLDQLKNDNSSIKSYIQEHGFTITGERNVLVNGIETIIIEAKKDNLNCSCVCINIDSNKYALLMVYNQSDDDFYSILKEILSIINNIGYSD